MGQAIYFGAAALWMISVGTLAAALGVTSAVIDIASLGDAPPGQSGFFDGLLQMVSWAWNAAASFFQIMTFQIDVPALANLLIITPIGFVTGFLIYKAVRG